MAELKILVLVEQDGVVLPGFPLVQRVVTEQVMPWTPVTLAAGGFTSLPLGSIASLKTLIVRPDRLVTLRYDGQTDAGIEIEPNGLLLVLGGRADAGITASAVDPTTIHGLAAGSPA